MQRKKSESNNQWEQAMDLAHGASQEIATAAVTHAFSTLPDHFVKVLPEKERTLAQKITATIADNIIYLNAKMMVNGDISLPEGIALCSTAAITKGMMLEDKNGMVPESYSKKDLEMIAQMAAQGCLTRVMQSQLEELAQHISDQSEQIPEQLNLPIPLMLLLTGAFQQFRIPGIPQATSEEETTLQKVGHLVSSATIMASMSIMRTSAWLGVAGCAAGIAANTFFGRKQTAKEITVNSKLSTSPSLH